MFKPNTHLAFGKHVPAGSQADPCSELLASNARLQHRLEGLQALLRQAQCSLQEDVSLAQSARKQQDLTSISQSDTRVKRKQRISDGLKSALAQLSTLQSELSALHQNTQAWAQQADQLSLAKPAPDQTSFAMAKANTTRAADLQVALQEAQATRIKQEEALQELEAVKKMVKDITERNNALAAELCNVSAARQQTEERTQAAESQVGDLTAALQEAKADRQVWQGKAERAVLAAQKHQDALARQTGDNLVLVLKLRQAEDAARGALAECDALKRRQEPWFDQVRQDMQERMAAALDQAAVLDAQMQAQAAQHERELAAAAANRGQVEAQLALAVARGSELATQVALAQTQAASALSTLRASEVSELEAKRFRDEAAAENRILASTVRQLQDECSISKGGQERANADARAADDQLMACRQQLNEAEVGQQDVQAQLDRLNGVNKELMQRKTEIEWQLVEAVALVEGKPSSPRIRSSRSIAAKQTLPQASSLSQTVLVS